MHTDADLPNVRSQTGVVILLQGKHTSIPLQWLSVEQSITADSVNKAEQIACHRGISEAIPISMDIEKLFPGIDTTIHTFVGNQLVLDNAKTPDACPPERRAGTEALK